MSEHVTALKIKRSDCARPIFFLVRLRRKNIILINYRVNGYRRFPRLSADRLRTVNARQFYNGTAYDQGVFTFCSLPTELRIVLFSSKLQFPNHKKKKKINALKKTRRTTTKTVSPPKRPGEIGPDGTNNYHLKCP